MLSISVRRSAAVGVSTLGLLGGSVLFGVSGAGAALPAGEDYAYTGEAQSYVVPSDVCTVEIVVAGAQGGTWVGESGEGETGEQLPGGAGGIATSEVTVAPGETLQVNVGGQGGDGDETDQGAGGWNGGGDGGAGVGGGGGGASDVRQGGTTLGDRVVVGGGGGGVGVDADNEMAPEFGVPGVGGNPATPGGDEPPEEPGYTPAQGGGAGTDTAGGAGGLGYRFSKDSGADGDAGALGLGGDGATPEGEASGIGGGGGGGGLYGGGGGGIGEAISDGAGGGGSSLGDTTQPGANEGAGSVTVTPTGDCTPPTTTSTTPSTTTTAPAPVQASDQTAPPASPVASNPTYTG